MKTASTIVIKPKDYSQSTAKTKSDIISSINPDNEPGISKVKRIKNGGLVLKCQNPNDLKKLTQTKDLSDTTNNSRLN